MDINSWLSANTSLLAAAGITTARLDALVLLEDCLTRDRSWLLAHPEHELTAAQVNTLDGHLQRRAVHEPLAYIRGHAEFYGRKFTVDNHVLVPRPESEAMIDLLKTLKLPANTRLADIGSGSGCLGVTAALELSLKEVAFHDIDPATLAVAEQNAKQYGLQGKLYPIDLLAAGDYDVVLANLPYVPDDYPVNEAAQREPALALYGGDDGLDLYRRLFAQAAARPQPPQYILTESLPEQHQNLQQIAAAQKYQLQTQLDFAQLFYWPGFRS